MARSGPFASAGTANFMGFLKTNLTDPENYPDIQQVYLEFHREFKDDVTNVLNMIGFVEGVKLSIL